MKNESYETNCICHRYICVYVHYFLQPQSNSIGYIVHWHHKNPPRYVISPCLIGPIRAEQSKSLRLDLATSMDLLADVHMEQVGVVLVLVFELVLVLVFLFLIE